MFWSKKTVCPIDTQDKDLIHELFRLLVDIFGLSAIRTKQIILPTAQYFNRNFTGAEHDAFYVFERLCRYMDIDTDAVEIKIYENLDQSPDGDDVENCSSRYIQHADGSVEIQIARNQLADPASLIATIAYELANYKLLGEGRITEANEVLTELTVILFGCGVFTANASVIKMESAVDLLGGQWNIRGGAGFMHYSLHGFALALYAHYRKEEDSKWVDYLESDVYKIFRQSKKYIEKHPDEFKLGAS